LKQDKKQLKRHYQQSALTLGVFLIRNTVNDKIFLASGQDLAGIINSQKFQLGNGVHMNKSLQADWNEIGAGRFAFEIVEQLNAPSDPQFDLKKELSFMEDMWLARLRPFGQRGYNEPKLSREEKLRRIARKRFSGAEDPDRRC